MGELRLGDRVWVESDGNRVPLSDWNAGPGTIVESLREGNKNPVFPCSLNSKDSILVRMDDPPHHNGANAGWWVRVALVRPL